MSEEFEKETVNPNEKINESKIEG